MKICLLNIVYTIYHMSHTLMVPLSTSNVKQRDGLTQTILSAVGKFPLGFGVFLLWPLVKKFGKRPVMIIGFSIAAAAELLCLLFSKSMPVITGIRRTSWACGW